MAHSHIKYYSESTFDILYVVYYQIYDIISIIVRHIYLQPHFYITKIKIDAPTGYFKELYAIYELEVTKISVTRETTMNN